MCLTDCLLVLLPDLGSPRFPYTTLFRSPLGEGMDVRPHPHIGLATLTYLFEGEVMHRDSLGTAQPIRPGEVNWMTAGRGIVHSRSEEHTSELQSRENLVCRLLLDKKNRT